MLCITYLIGWYVGKHFNFYIHKRCWSMILFCLCLSGFVVGITVTLANCVIKVSLLCSWKDCVGLIWFLKYVVEFHSKKIWCGNTCFGEYLNKKSYLFRIFVLYISYFLICDTSWFFIVSDSFNTKTRKQRLMIYNK